MSLPKTTKAWVIHGTDPSKGFDNLKLEEVPVEELGESPGGEIDADCTRDLFIPQGAYPFPLKPPIIACSDGAGKVIAVGKKVTEFSVGDKVVTSFYQGHQYGDITEPATASGLGGGLHGTLRHYGVFPQNGLALAPSNLTPTGAGTLSCAALTAWNALYGLASKAIKPGSVVLTQGTGGVSLAAIQLARAAGAIVIATTSSDEKVKRLEQLGANIVINYKKDPHWGKTAKRLSPRKEGADHVIEVGGPGTMEQSMKAVKLEGVIDVIGFLAGPKADNEPSALESLRHCFMIRGILVGSRAQLQQMNRAIEANAIDIVVDEKIFNFEDAKEAYKYQWDQKNFGKVVIKLD
ncbi:hypothetical protein AYO21_06480 [Fonsecaea monophora]|uniref:Enoyl reductase (ER) domain-containing protein n=1 Tax=Fonsecaea monophora TaxID=254056 RepID=A0A177F600_9EURO|nr:hypothetical protein AYO21_06480 [Fonsecaea monophora]OAG39276.1 hypothetical protein AYO21_06480 [Fonsecaea monophora]